MTCIQAQPQWIVLEIPLKATGIQEDTAIQ